MKLAVAPPLVKPAHVKLPLAGDMRRGKGEIVAMNGFLLHGVQADATDLGGSPGKVGINYSLIEPHGFKYLGAPIAL